MALTPEQVAKTKRRILNPDKSVSTERTIGIEADGRFINIPTIVGGKQLSNQDAIRMFREGKNPPTGVFRSRAERDRRAALRSDRIGRAINKNESLRDRIKRLTTGKDGRST